MVLKLFEWLKREIKIFCKPTIDIINIKKISATTEIVLERTKTNCSFNSKKKGKNYKSIRYILSRFLKLLEQSKTISLKK